MICLCNFPLLISIPAYRKVIKFIKKVKAVPGNNNICHVVGYVFVPNNSPAVNANNKIDINPTIKIAINGQLLIIYLKSILDSFHVVFTSFQKEKS